jgi:hypothetical protein
MFKNIKKQKSLLARGLVILLIFASAIAVIACTKNPETPGEENNDPPIVTDGFKLVDNGASLIYAEGENVPGLRDGEYAAVTRVAYDLASDIEKVTGVKAEVIDPLRNAVRFSEYAVIIGTIGRSATIDNLITAGKLNASGVEGKWEVYSHTLVKDPFGDGRVKTALVIAGSDKRGSIYGAYDISEKLGVSAWNFFADNKPIRRDNLTMPENYNYLSSEPTVKYRGIFINDEEKLEAWDRVLDDGKHSGPELYKKVFELLLRLKANFLWPAMHAASDAFSAYAENPVNADYYGVVLGTTHPDMLMRNNENEWGWWREKYVIEYNKEHPQSPITVDDVQYDYTVSSDALLQYWRESAEMYKDYEVQWTVGMRGIHDSGLVASRINQAPWNGNYLLLLQTIIEQQQNILRDVLGKDDLSDEFMMFIPYKEVQELYNQGLQVPDDVTIMWTEDNHGFIRNLPNADEREREGGSGVYYHISYWGADNESYLWMNSMPLTLIYSEMGKAVDYGATKAWLLNVGDLVPGQYEIDFFLDLAYNAEKYNDDNVYEEFNKGWAAREIGAEYAEEVAAIQKEYGQLTNARKLEHMAADLFTDAYYGDEFEKRMAMYKELLGKAEDLYSRVPAEKKDFFYETVLYQIRSAYYVNAEYYYANKADFAAKQGRNATAYNSYGLALEYNQMRKQENSYYNKVLAGGKWNNIIDPEIAPPPSLHGFAESGAWLALGVNAPNAIVEGEELPQAESALKFYNYASGRKFLDIFNGGVGQFSYEITAPGWVGVSSLSGSVIDEDRVWISVNFSALSASASGNLIITYKDTNGAVMGAKTVVITAQVDNIAGAAADSREGAMYIEQDGYISIEAEHYTRINDTNIGEWRVIKDLGRVYGDMLRAEAPYLTGYNENNYTSGAWVEYDVYTLTSGTFNVEFYRLPTLSSLGRVRVAVSIDGKTPLILEGANDYGSGKLDWEEGIFTQVQKHKFTLNFGQAGKHTIKVFMIDPFVAFDKIVVYTTQKVPDSYFGPDESYNSYYQPHAMARYEYERFYTTKYFMDYEMDKASEWGSGYVIEQNGSLYLETAIAAENSQYARIENYGNPYGWKLSMTNAGYDMRTVDVHKNYAGNSEAPRLIYELSFTTTGTYNVWVKYNAPMPTSGHFDMKLNNVAINGLHNGNGLFTRHTMAIYEWKLLGAINIGVAGVKEFVITAMADGVGIGAVYFTKGSTDPSAVNIPLKASLRSPIRDTQELAVRNILYTALNARAQNRYNINSGEGSGLYGTAEKLRFLEAMKAGYALYNSLTAVASGTANAAVNEINNAYAALIASKNNVSGGQTYAVYEDYSGYQTGLAPFGTVTDKIVGLPALNILESGTDRYLSYKTARENYYITSGLSAGYNFDALTGKGVTVEITASFNWASWGVLAELKNAAGKTLLTVGYESLESGVYNIVAYNAHARETIGKYVPGEFADIKIVADADGGVYDVYINGNKAASAFKFSDAATGGVTSYRFGSFGSRDVELRIKSLKIYKENTAE